MASELTNYDKNYLLKEVHQSTLNSLLAKSDIAALTTKLKSAIGADSLDAFTYTKKDEDDLTPKTKENFSLEELQKTWIAKMEENTIFISALNKTNFEQLRKLLYKKVKVLHIKRYPYNNFLY